MTKKAVGRSTSRLALTALDRKLVRDLWASRGQALAIALVIGAGIAVFLSMFSTFDSLDLTLRTYYERSRFGDVFASLKRAPLSRAADIAAVPGVAQVEPRVVVDVTLDVPGLAEPAIGRLISVPAVAAPHAVRRRAPEGALHRGGEARRGAGQRDVCDCARLRAGRLRRGDHQRPPPGPADRGPGAFARVHLPDPAGRAAAGREALRRVLDGRPGAGVGIQHVRRVQRRRGEAHARRVGAGGDRAGGPAPRTRLRGPRRDPAIAATVELVPGQRTGAAADVRRLRAGDLPGRGGLSAERGALTHRAGPAGADRRPQGARLRQRGSGVALREVEPRRGRCRGRRLASHSGLGSDGP